MKFEANCHVERRGVILKLDEYIMDFLEDEGFYFPHELQVAYVKFLVELSNYRDKLKGEKQLPLLLSDNVGSSVVDLKIKIDEEVDKFFNPMAFIEDYYSDVFDINNLNTFYDFLRKADDREVEFFSDWFEDGLLDQIGVDVDIVNGIFKERAQVTEEEFFGRKVDQKTHLQLVDE